MEIYDSEVLSEERDRVRVVLQGDEATICLKTFERRMLAGTFPKKDLVLMARAILKACESNA